MTNEQAIEMMKAKLECMTREVSGVELNCNAKKCDACDLCYAQGNMGEQKEWLRIGIKALEQEPCEDCISRQAVLKIFSYVMDYWKEHAIDVEPHEIEDAIIEQYTFTAKELSKLPPVIPQQKIGHWIDDNDGYGTSCSECGKWYTHPYLTKEEIIYCCRCGAKMLQMWCKDGGVKW